MVVLVVEIQHHCVGHLLSQVLDHRALRRVLRRDLAGQRLGVVPFLGGCCHSAVLRGHTTTTQRSAVDPPRLGTPLPRGGTYARHSGPTRRVQNCSDITEGAPLSWVRPSSARAARRLNSGQRSSGKKMRAPSSSTRRRVPGMVSREPPRPLRRRSRRRRCPRRSASAPCSVFSRASMATVCAQSNAARKRSRSRVRCGDAHERPRGTSRSSRPLTLLRVLVGRARAPAASGRTPCPRASPSSVAAAARRPAAIARNGLNASGGQLSWASQSVSVRLRTRSGMRRREDLRDAAAAVVADEVDLRRCRARRGTARASSRSRSTTRPGRARSRCAPCASRSSAMQRRMSDSSRELMTPQIAVQQHAVDEQRDRSGALFA